MIALLLLATFSASALSLPTLSWTPALGEYYSTVDQHIKEAKAAGTFTAPSCALSQASQVVAPTPLPSPSPSWQLAEVVIGRGVQNYTCASADPTVIPKAVGAVASLYNISCIASNYPDVLEMLPGLVLQYPLPPSPTAQLQPSNIDLTGHHYFTANGTPAFDLTYDSANDLGMSLFKKVAVSDAPADAVKGQNGVGNGAVQWLYLTSTDDVVGNLAAVYRLNTAGGNPPPNCQSSPAYFSVQYAAEYWFYVKSPGS